MPTIPCPTCRARAVRRLDAISAVASVAYYRCDACAQVWHVPKGPEADITPPAVTPPARQTSATATALRVHLATLTWLARGVHDLDGPEDDVILRQLITELPIAALVADDHARYVLANRAAADLTGYSIDELSHRSTWDI